MLLKSLPLFAVVAGLSLSGCDSKQEKAREEALEKKADALEEQADNAPTKTEEKSLEKQADATREAK